MVKRTKCKASKFVAFIYRIIYMCVFVYVYECGFNASIAV